MKYAMTESAKPQKLHINWSMVLMRDDCSDTPEERDDGFWPSLDPNEAGYVGANCSKKEFARQKNNAETRMAAWRADDWCYIGVIARASLMVPVGGNNFRLLTIDSAGLWGIESDSGDYLREVFEEEKGEVENLIKALGQGLSDAIKTDGPDVLEY